MENSSLQNLKMSPLCFLSLFLVLALCICNTSVIGFPEVQAGMNLHSALPVEALPVNVSCSSGSNFSVKPNENYTWGVPLHKVDTCHAQWGRLHSDFTAHDPDTDIGHTIVYWEARYLGLFKSFDQQNWEKKAGWDF